MAALRSDIWTTSRLYWIGLYESDSKKWKWFLHVDLAPIIGCYAKRLVGEGKHTLPSHHRVVVTAGIDVKTNIQSCGCCSSSTACYSSPRWETFWATWLCFYTSAPTLISPVVPCGEFISASLPVCTFSGTQ